MADPVTSTNPSDLDAATAAAVAENKRLADQAARDRDAAAASRAGTAGNSLSDMLSGILNWFIQLWNSILHPGQEDEHSPNQDSPDDHTPPPTTAQALENAVATSRKVTPAWQALIKENNGKPVVLSTPIKGETEVISEFGGQRQASGVLKAHKHGGVDLAGAPHTPLIAAADGVVLRRGFDAGGWGNFVELGLADGTTIIYAHMFSRSPLEEGTKVDRGAQVGEMGNTGNAAHTQTHCHFEHQGKHAIDSKCFDGKHINPEINGFALHNYDRINQNGQVTASDHHFAHADVKEHQAAPHFPRTSTTLVQRA